MSIINMATQLFLKNTAGGSGLNGDMVGSALKHLLPSKDGDLDIGSLVSKFASGNLSSMASSWLGDETNDSMSGTDITEVLGQEKISSFASELGIDSDTATQGLTGMIPDLVDQSSSGGSLLDSIGGAAGIAGMAKKLF